MGDVQLGRMQFRGMQVLRDRGRAGAREVTDALSASEPVARSTVQTLPRQLEAKGAIGHEAAGRAFAFVPRPQEDRVKRPAARALGDRAFGGDVGGPVAHLLRRERLTVDELAETRRLVAREGGGPAELGKGAGR